MREKRQVKEDNVICYTDFLSGGSSLLCVIFTGRSSHGDGEADDDGRRDLGAAEGLRPRAAADAHPK